MEAKWTVFGKRADFSGIGEKFNIDQVIARVIRNRDIIGDEEIQRYLYGDFSMTHEPLLMKDMEKACQIMKSKIEDNKKIRIISDYDVDGVMSNYILLQGLLGAGADASYEIPDRILDGYGINERIINDAHSDGIDTIITCDNGIAAFPAITLAKEYGMTVIVTDHHEVPYELDESGEKVYKIVPADAVIDPKQVDCKYPYKGLCGAGVAYKFIRALYKMMGIDWEDEELYIDMLAIATVCDVMELTDENRIYVKAGLNVIPRTKNIGLRALVFENNLQYKKIATYTLGFVLGPCINAAGRLESAKKGLNLLLCQDEREAKRQAAELISVNTKRKQMTEEGEKQAIEVVEKNYADDKVLVVYVPELHESLAGIVAGRIREKYYRPVFVITDAENNMVKGSGRSIEGYHMFEALNEVKEHLDKFGGHELAAGLSLKKDNLDDFRRALNEKQRLTEEILTPKLRIDVPMPISYISRALVNQLELLEPFGKGNEKPIFAQAGLGIKRAYLCGSDKQFIKIYFQDENGFVMEAMDFKGNKFQECIKLWFSDAECDKMLRGMPNSIKLDVAYYPEINDFKNQSTLQIKPLFYKKSQA